MPLKDPEKRKAYNAEWRKNNKEKVKAHRTKYCKNNKEKIKAREAEYRKKNKGARRAYRFQYHIDNKEAENTAKAAWRKNNPEKHNATNARRRAKKRNAPGRGITGTQWVEIIQTANGICSYCDGEFESLQLDHIVPLDKGGAHDIDNVTPTCKSCNCSKGTRLLHEEWTPPNEQ